MPRANLGDGAKELKSRIALFCSVEVDGGGRTKDVTVQGSEALEGCDGKRQT